MNKSRKIKHRFANLENEKDVQRKIYEETLKKKKDLLNFEFQKMEEVNKYEALSIKSNNEIKFKYEFDR